MKPEFTGKVGMMDDPLGNMMIGALVATGTQTPTKINAAQLEQTIDFLIELKKQSRVVAASWGDLSDAIARGDVAITFNGWETMVKFCADKGKVVKYAYPVRAHPRLARQLLHRQGRAEPRRRLRAVQPGHLGGRPEAPRRGRGAGDRQLGRGGRTSARYPRALPV